MRAYKIIEIVFEGVLSDEIAVLYEQSVPVTAQPTPGAIEWLAALLADPRFDVHLHSFRFSRPEGIAAVSAWLRKHGLESKMIERLALSAYKPLASVTIDSRAWRFTGRWPGAPELLSFTPSSRVDGIPTALDIVESNRKTFTGVNLEEVQTIWERDCICSSCLHEEVCALESTQKGMGLFAIIKRCAQYIPINWDGTSCDSE